MAQISKGDTFIDGQQVTGARLNQLVDAGQLLVGAITDQPSITANTLEATDSTIVNDAGTLKESTIGDILNSNLPITTSSITGGASVDITVTPAAGKKMDVGGAFEAESINVIGNSTVGGNQTITGDLTVTGNIGGNINTAGNITSSGTANFTGTLQINGVVGYCLYAVTEEVMTTVTPASGVNTAAIFTSAAFTKPTDEIWIFEADFHLYGVSGWGFAVGFRYGSVAAFSGAYHYTRFWTVAGNTSPEFHHETTRWIARTGTTFTAETVKCDARNSPSANLTAFPTSSSIVSWIGFGTTNVTPSKFRIYKYKTA